MRSVGAFICVFSLLISQGSSLSCVDCSGSGSSCTANNITCPEGYLCGSLYTVTTIPGGPVDEVIVRSCSTASKCNVNAGISNSFMNIQYASTCCNTDNCTPTTPTILTSSAHQNGVICRACFSAVSDWCNSSETLKCTGDEDTCVLLSTSVSATKAAIRGCATKNYCDIIGQTSTQDINVTCTSGDDSLSCVNCSGPGSSCTGNTTTCPYGYLCGSKYKVTTDAAGAVNETVVRSCIPASECSLNENITTSNMRVQYASSCCNSDNCTPTKPSFPTSSSPPNGVICRSCFSAISDWCYTNETMQCTGVEDTCIFQATTTSAVKTAMRGCATRRFCEIIGQISPEEIIIKCTSGSLQLTIGIYLPTFLSILMLTFFS